MSDESEKTAVLALDDLKLLQPDESRTAYLIVIKGRAVGKMYMLQDATTVLGRASDVQVLIEDEGVSRRHARIEYDFSRRQFTLTPLGKNGVSIEGVYYTRNSGPLLLHTR